MVSDKVLIGRYELHELLGRGGMAEVHLATDRRLGRQVAVKLLAADLLGDEQAIARFAHEAQTAAALKHPNVVSVHDAANDGQHWFIVMELVEGPTLADEIARIGRLPEPLAVRIAARIADALAFAHARGVVHRDVKPGNVLFDADGTVKVADFGIARAMTAEATMVRGSPHYLAPEQARGRPADPRSDVYALGCVLFEMLAGRPPFAGDNATEVIRRQVTEPAPSLTRFRPDVSDAVAGQISRALEKRPGDRHGSIAELRDALERHAERPWSRGVTRVLPTDHTLAVGASAGAGSAHGAGLAGRVAPRGHAIGGRRWIFAATLGVAAVVAGMAWSLLAGSGEPAALAAPAPSYPPSPSPSREPAVTTLTIDSDPPGLAVSLGDRRDAAPVTGEHRAGSTVSVSAPSPQTVDGVTYAFDAWSDGGGTTHAVDVPDTDVTLTASFREIARVPDLSGHDIGDVRLPGGTVRDDDAFTVVGAGRDIWKRRDEFHLASVPMSGDVALTARITGQSESHEWAKAGLMVRGGLAASAPNVLLARTPGNGLTFQWREGPDDRTEDLDGGAVDPAQWLRLVRTGDQITGYRSADGATWQQVASATVSLGEAIEVGLAVTSHERRAMSQATFDQVQVARPGDVRSRGTVDAPVTSEPPAAASGCPADLWTVAYFPNTTLAGDAAARGCEDAIAHDWGLAGPGGEVPDDGFSARWTRTSVFEPGTYELVARSDDGMRVSVDGQPVLDHWSDHPAEAVSAERALGGEHAITVEYYDRSGGAVAEFDWRRVD